MLVLARGASALSYGLDEESKTLFSLQHEDNRA
jgi:hypothetical protein